MKKARLAIFSCEASHLWRIKTAPDYCHVYTHKLAYVSKLWKIWSSLQEVNACVVVKIE